jgi:hypothetical protein
VGGHGRKAARYAQQQGRGFRTRNDKIGSLSGKADADSTRTLRRQRTILGRG